MGKRKSSSKPQRPKKADPLPTVFTCLFCNHEKSVVVKINKKAGVGQLDCQVCGQSFQCLVNYLSAPVDVYAEWVDAADAVADDAPPDLLDMTKIAPRVGGGRAVREHAEQANSRDRRRASYDDDEDDDMDEDDDE